MFREKEIGLWITRKGERGCTGGTFGTMAHKGNAWGLGRGTHGTGTHKGNEDSLREQGYTLGTGGTEMHTWDGGNK